MKRKDLTKHFSQTVSELQKEVASKKENLFTAQADIKKGTTKNVKATRVLRREIAQLLTIINQKKEVTQ